MSYKLKQLILLIGDILILNISLYVALALRYFSLPDEGTWQSHQSPFLAIFFIWLIIFYIANLYDLKIAVNGKYFFQHLGKIILVAGSIALGFFYLYPGIGIAPKTNLLIFLAVFTAMFFLWRQAYNYVLKSYLPKNVIGILGYNPQVRELISEFRDRPSLGYRIAFIADSGLVNTPLLENITVIRDLTAMHRRITGSKISSIVLASSPRESSELRSSLFSLLPLEITFISLPKFYESVTGKVPIEAINQMWFLENLSEGDKAWFNRAKRAYDLVLAAFILILTLPFWPLIALMIKYGSSGPVFFVQTRSGKHGIPFNIIKFRTMKTEKNDNSPTAIRDARITRFGAFLRKTRIDEIPQVINILAGEMSFVGPRPERPELIEELEKKIPFYRERMLVYPGVTGWDQVSGEYHSPSYEDTIKKLQYDLYYIKNRSLYLDFSILLKTLATMVSSGGR